MAQRLFRMGFFALFLLGVDHARCTEITAQSESLLPATLSCVCDCVVVSANKKTTQRLAYCEGKEELPLVEKKGFSFPRCMLAYQKEEAFRFPRCKVCEEEAVESCEKTGAAKMPAEPCEGWLGKTVIEAAKSEGTDLFTILFQAQPAPSRAAGVYKNCALVKETF